MAAIFELGDIFNSFIEFESKLRDYQQQNHVVFVKQFSSKLTDHPDSNRLQYNFVKFACKQGPKRKSKSQGVRPNQRTVKQDCGAYIRLIKEKYGENLVLRVKAMDLNHTNHPVDHKTASVYPENRRPVITETVKAMVGANVTRKCLRNFISETQGIRMLPQDIYNMSRRMNVCDKNDSEGVEELLRIIRNQGGCTKFGMNESGEFEYVLFMSSEMKNDLIHFPDILVMDVTYKVNKYLYPLVNVMCVDAEGSGRPVLHGFIRSESCVSVIACLDFLKSIMIDASCKPSVFFLDKDLSEIAAVRETFPGTLVRLCSFHTATAVKRALVKQNLTSSKVVEILSYFKEQRDSRSQERYQQIIDLIRQNAPDETVRYFETNWWSKADIWAAHTRLHLQTLHVTTTNHVESYHSKIKQTLNIHTRLTDCMKTLLDHDADLIRTKDIKSHLHNISHSYNVKHTDPQLERLINCLTSFSGKLVTEQYNLSKTIQYTHVSLPSSSTSENRFQTTGETLTRNTYSSSPSSCDCDFFSNFSLPCRHIFSLRNDLALPLYSLDLLSNSRFLKTELVDSDRDNLPSSPHETDIIPTRRRAHTQEGRYRIVSAVTSRLNAVFSVMGETCFNHRVEQLEQFLDLVTKDQELCILGVDRGALEANTMDIDNLTQHNSDFRTTETLTPVLDSEMVSTGNFTQIDNALTGLSATETSHDVQSPIYRTDHSYCMPSTEISSSTIPLQADFDETLTEIIAPPDDSGRPSCFAAVKLPKVKVRGRPRKVQAFTRQHGVKKRLTKTAEEAEQLQTRTDNVTVETTAAADNDSHLKLLTKASAISFTSKERVCGFCGVREYDKNVSTKEQRAWVHCKKCALNFHKQCLSSGTRESNFFCTVCLPIVIEEMQNVLDDCIYNSSL